SISSAMPPTWNWWRASSAEAFVLIGSTQPQASKRAPSKSGAGFDPAAAGKAPGSADHAAPPAPVPHGLADGPRVVRGVGRGRDAARFRHMSGDLEPQLGADRVTEFLPFPDRHHEGARSADHAVLVVDVEIWNIQGRGIGALEHDRQAVD